ncbi:hypothetical protein FBUS_10550 [Fasciolopsis buskii]|uniref:BPTI/Kunitz inhibitor domain-containing protein n=1 Tax=Fasciolopsis buskii TaxID=27845 RepID=A0A8E0VJE6_9TREM|nr:hypothetical protein FBUS_10550 [Fasciolopsis buski]
MDPDKDTLLGHPSDSEHGNVPSRCALRIQKRRRMRRGWIACLVLIGFGVFLLMLLGASYMAHIYLPNVAEIMHPDCMKKLEPGDGNLSLPRWGWDIPKGRCVEFIYRGEGGNGNLFLDEASCEKKCPRRVLI